jgi:foldase protein PrsA
MLSSLYSPSSVHMSRFRTFILPLAACVAVAFTVAACGGDDDGQTSETTPPPAETTDTAPAPAEEPTPAEPTPAEPAGGEPDPVPAEPEPAPAELSIASNDVPMPTTVPAGAIAVVGNGVVEQAEFDQLISQRELTTVNQGGEFPNAGTPEYESVKNQLIDFLVRRETFTQEAEAIGLEISDEDVEAQLVELREQFFEGDDDRYQEELENQGLTEEQVFADIKFQQLTDSLFARVTQAITLDDAVIEAYYEENAESFTSPESREVAHILVETEGEADALKVQLDNGGDFASLAEENSIDEGTAVTGGAYTAVRGLSVPEFDEVAFELETGEISDPVETQFGWHIIKALEDAVPAGTQTLEEVRDQVEGLVRRDREAEVVDLWLAAIDAKYGAKILYAPGFAPPASPVDDAELPEGEGTEGSAP